MRFTTPLLVIAALLSLPAWGLAQARPTSGVQVQTESTVESPSANQTSTLAEELGWELAAGDDGVRIERIVKNSPVAQAHLEEKDIITKVGGENVLTADRISEIISEILKEGETKTDIVVLRDGEELSYLLEFQDVAEARGGATTRTSVSVSQSDLPQLVQQLQLELQQQRALLQMLLTEVQALRQGSAAGVRTPVAPAGGTQFTGDIVAPLGGTGVAPVPGVNPGGVGTGAGNPAANPPNNGGGTNPGTSR